jgi:branched-chain amino acid transport system substrate-binding protein
MAASSSSSTRDDARQARGRGARTPSELVTRARRSALLAGAFLSNVGLALADFALAEQGVLPGQRTADRQDRLGPSGNRYTYPPARQHLHAVRHAGARGGQAAGKKRWAHGGYPNYEYGQSAVALASSNC